MEDPPRRWSMRADVPGVLKELGGEVPDWRKTTVMDEIKVEDQEAAH